MCIRDRVRVFRSVQRKQPVLRLLRTAGDIRDTALAAQRTAQGDVYKRQRLCC